jgi:hypothetical protein
LNTAGPALQAATIARMARNFIVVPNDLQLRFEVKQMRAYFLNLLVSIVRAEAIPFIHGH